MEEAGKGLALSSSVTETLGVGEDATTVEVSDSGVCDVSGTDRNPDDGGSAADDGKTGNSVSDVNHVKADVTSLEDLVASKDNVEETVSSGDVERTDAHTETEVERNQMESEGDAGAVEVKPVNGESQESAGGEETVISCGNEVTDEKDKCEVEETNEEDGEMLSVAEDEADQEEETAKKSEEDDNKMDVDSKQANEEDVVPHDPGSENKDATHSESARDVPIDEAARNDSSLVMEMEIDEREDDANMATGLTGAVESAALANPNSSTEDAATGNIQDLKTETANVSLKDDKKATECPTEASDAVMGSDENQEEKGHECIGEKAVDQQDAMGEEDESTHEPPGTEPTQKGDTEMEENPNNFDFADDGTDSDMKTNGVKRKADALSEDSPGEGRKTVSFAKVSFAQRPSFKIGACIARAASQMAGSPSVLKGSNFGDETLSVESFVSQLHCVATDPVKENVVSEIAAGFFLDFRNSLVSEQDTTEKVSKKRGRPSNSSEGGDETFEFEEMGDTYWTDRVIHNGGEEQTPPTDKVEPVELKPAQVKRARRPYRRRQSQISIPLPSASDKPAGFDENAPAEIIMKFSETDTIPPEKSLSKMFRHFGPIRESQTEVDREKNRARVVFRKGADAEVAYNSAGKFNIFGTKAVNYELSFTITETFTVQPYVVSLGEEEPALSLPS